MMQAGASQAHSSMADVALRRPASAAPSSGWRFCLVADSRM